MRESDSHNIEKLAQFVKEIIRKFNLDPSKISVLSDRSVYCDKILMSINEERIEINGVLIYLELSPRIAVKEIKICEISPVYDVRKVEKRLLQEIRLLLAGI